MDTLEQHYPHAVPAVHHALCAAAHQVGSHEPDSIPQHGALGRFDGW